MSKPMRSLAITIAALTLFSCGAFDGGSRGTGITSTVKGNVASVDASDANLDGITVSVEGKKAHTATHSEGKFRIHGVFEGNLILHFLRPADRTNATAAINLPARGTLIMNNVHIDNPSAKATAESLDVDFQGTIKKVDCPNQKLKMVSTYHSPSDNDSYIIDLSTSTVRDRNGNPVACGDLTAEQQAHVRGTVDNDSSYSHCTITLRD